MHVSSALTSDALDDEPWDVIFPKVDLTFAATFEPVPEPEPIPDPQPTPDPQPAPALPAAPGPEAPRPPRRWARLPSPRRAARLIRVSGDWRRVRRQSARPGTVLPAGARVAVRLRR